ncbi:hypothetical protein BS47DRAFT_1361306 [Hydnum rufescens UP504]|uniref:hydroxymethylglutaryl-CoA lyase n=1 Tax=Hydnum rufescens UP504 TaxID=1448309 RepID=A0A9P6DYL7_9AGAM|nr:hypothetical protein BS47DRAFT_1361306 [Hydnum rufescens UP504]
MSRRSFSSKFVRIVEVGPRDGLQNEPIAIHVHDRIALIERLADAGLGVIEAGSFVSPKRVPQMAGTSDVLRGLKRRQDTRYPVLVPNMKGLLTLLDGPSLASLDEPPLTDEIAIFAAASESFSKANINCSISESLDRLAPVAELALNRGLRVRGYVSTVISCSYEGPIAPKSVRDVAKALVDMGCYEVSLGDTTGFGTPRTMTNMLDVVMAQVSVDKLANHDTYGMGIANVLTAIEAGIRTVDSSVAGLGGCPFSPGATGNVATEDVVHALHGIGYSTDVDLPALVAVGEWISAHLGRANESRAGRAWASKARSLADSSTRATS